MKFMDEATSWKLLSKIVFGRETCPHELEDIGKKIVEGCRGLPLSIVVVGGLLSKSEATRENWQVIEENLSSIVNAEDDGKCLQLLYMSYNNMPVHIKPCFLYIGVYPEDEEIPVTLLIQLWVAEGFIKPIDGKSLEEAAEEYLEELVDRNLVLVDKRNHYGKLELCKIHDLLRDLALREGEKEKLLYWLKQSSGAREISQGMISTRCRITNLLKDKDTSSTVVLESVEAAAASSLVRSLIGRFSVEILTFSSIRLLRVCVVEPEEESTDENHEENLIRLLNLRLLLFNVEEHPLPKIPSYLWNLQRLMLLEVEKDYVLEIWKMPLLSMTSRARQFASPNLRWMMKEVRNLTLGEEVLKRIPNMRILKLDYEEDKKGDYYCVKNLNHLDKLQELCLIWDSRPMRELVFPYSLKQLILCNTHLPWEEMASKIGCLPLLQVLQLKEGSFIGSEWETVEGKFSSLKVLNIEDCNDLEWWITDNTHFPRLEHLVFYGLLKLREIPSSIGDIPTLRSVKVELCSDSAVESARRIQEEQEEYGNVVLRMTQLYVSLIR